MYKGRIIFIVIAFLVQTQLSSQVVVHPSLKEGSNIPLKNLLEATVINPNRPLSVTLMATVTYATLVDTFLQLEFESFLLHKGVTRLRGASLFVDSSHSRLPSYFGHNFLQGHSVLPKGEYRIYWQLVQKENDSLLAAFEFPYASTWTISIEQVPDTAENGLYYWKFTNENNPIKDDSAVASIQYYKFRRGKYSLISPFGKDSIANPVFSPEQQLQENYRYDKNGAYFFQITVFNKGNILAQSEKTPLVLFNKELPNAKNIFGGIKKESPLVEEKKYWENQYKMKALKKESPIKLTGTINSENGYSNIKYPFQIAPPVYSRIVIAPTLTFFGLPVTARLLLSTENSTQYPVNSFSAGINTPLLKDNYLKQLKNENEQEDILKQNMKKDFLETDAYLKKLEEKKQGYEDSLKIFKPNKEFTEQLKQVATEKFQDSAGNWIEKIDTTDINDKFPKHSDSLQDSAKYFRVLNEYNKTVYQYDKTRRKMERLKGFSQLDTDSLKNSLTTVAGDSMKSLKPKSTMERLIRGVKSFDIGIVYPLFSETTLKGLPVKGVYTSFVFTNFFISASAGKTLRVNAPDYINNNPPPEFKRNMIAAKGGLGNPDSNNVYISSIYFKDPNDFIFIDSNRVIAPKQNSLFSLGGKWVLKKITFDGELTSSQYHQTDMANRNELATAYNTSDDYFMNKALVMKGVYSYSENTNLSLQYKTLGAGYVSLGAPFLRRDYREVEAKVKHTLWKKKITLTAFYKHNQDNLSHQKSYQTTIQGYGFTLKTKFKKVPNVVVTHTPYEMNSEFKPTIFTQNMYVPNLVNRFQLTTVNVYHAFTFARTMFMVNTGYLNNVIQNSSGQKFSQQSYSSTINATLPKGNVITTTAGVYKTLPKVDTLNVKFIESAISFYAFKKVSAVAGLSYHQNNSYVFKYGGFVQANYAIKQFVFVLRFAYNRLNGDWEVNNNTEICTYLGISYGF